MKGSPAAGTKGILIRLMDGDVVFRVYNEDHSFTDYDILHHDLSVTITDEDAELFKNGEENWIDYKRD